MPATRSKKKANKVAPLPFDQRLVLNRYILSLFGKKNFNELADLLKNAEEGLDEDNVSRFYYSLMGGLPSNSALTKDMLLGYDENIVRHTLTIQGKRLQPIRWKYFQYLSLLFAEIYLDRYFRDTEAFLTNLNIFVERFNEELRESDRVHLYRLDDLQKLAFWNATGSGKTLLMHINIKQYLYYLERHGHTQELNRIILLTPNEGLSRQHLEEFALSDIPAGSFSKSGRSLFTGKGVEVIEIQKLRDEMGQTTVAVDAFESNNLVLVDEGHRGSSGEEWKARRDKLCEQGFSFEYSATFGQAMKASNNPNLVQEYAKCILFDYSYKYFYRDGYGKDYRIFNLADDRDEESRKLYLTACLLTFYQQKRLYQDEQRELQPFLLESPLWVFVGGSVNAVRTRNKQRVSDVIDILLFLAEFVGTPEVSCDRLARLLSGSPGLLDDQQRELFSTAFTYVHRLRSSAQELFEDVLKLVFNSPSQAQLYVENLKGVEGEIALRVGSNDPFGVINVGDASTLCKLCEEHTQLSVSESDFATSLFNRINHASSTINILIGSKKFTEGWSSWRVSTMGLMNIGRGEGSEIIQLFGRGVRLRGYDFGLKRSQHVSGIHPPDRISTLETLNIFGVRADYMQQFREYLEEEGLPTHEDRIEFILPIVRNLGSHKLKIPAVKAGVDFKTQAPKLNLDQLDRSLSKSRVMLDWYPKIQARQSRELRDTLDTSSRHEGSLTNLHFAFMDLNAIYLELQRFKTERGWHNFNLSLAKIEELLNNPDWYCLYIPPEELELTTFEKVRYWQEIAITLLKKYCDRYYRTYKDGWERQHLEYKELSEEDPNLVQEYQFLIEQSQQEILETLQNLKQEIEAGNLRDAVFANFHAIAFQQHLYEPLIYLKSDHVEVSPVQLNQGEKEFILDLRKFYERDRSFFSDKELYLLRNQSRGRGIGFFEAGNFYPDFILWLIVNQHQYITFVDPKGLRNLQGQDDPKIQFYQTIKEIETRLGNSAVTLNSFIISATAFNQIQWWGSAKSELEQYNVLFQEDKNTYINKLLSKAVGLSTIA
jgi:Type III restriction enzyme, res subunit